VRHVVDDLLRPVRTLDLRERVAATQGPAIAREIRKTAASFTPRCVSMIDTVAPPITAPVESETAPMIRPVLPPCANAETAATSKTKAPPTIQNTFESFRESTWTSRQ